MMELMRRFGIGLMVLGVVLVAAWAFEPIAMLWPWVRGLPLPIRVGVIVAAIGIALLIGSLIQERLRDRERDKSLLEDEI